MNRMPDLTCDVVDDLLWASSKGRLKEPKPGQYFCPRRIGPLVELALHQARGAWHDAIVNSAWIDPSTQLDFRSALTGTNTIWLDGPRLRGLLPTTSRPHTEGQELTRTSFLLAARKAAETVGFPVAIAQSLVAAMREMESNIHEHSGAVKSGIIAYYARPLVFEFVIADAGVGVLATLREAPEFRNLEDHGRALHTALQEGSSRYGRAANRGSGFNELFVGLVNLNADLRFRSGDHALTIRGPYADLKTARLAQKPPYQGFLVSVRCELPNRSFATH